jgi:hypothetical protein
VSGRSDVTRWGREGYHPHRESGEKEEALTGEILDKFSQLITTALGLVAALAWNDAIQTIFQEFLGTAGGAIAAKLFYALLVTLVVIFATIAVSRAAERTKKLEEEQNKGLLGLGRSSKE